MSKKNNISAQASFNLVLVIYNLKNPDYDSPNSPKTYQI